MVLGQTIPDWSKTYGEKDHSNRDEIHFSEKDSDGNLIIVCNVEGDSIFSAIEVQKISPDGNLIWKRSFSSGIGTNYDRPIKVEFSNQGDIFIIGYVPNEYYFYGSGYLTRISKNGEQEWFKELEDIVGDFEFFDLSDLLFGSDGEIHLTVSTKRANSFPTYFLSFDIDGNLTGNIQKTGLKQASAGGNDAFFQGTTNDKFYFLIRNGFGTPKTIRIINPITKTDESFPVSYQSFSGTLLSTFKSEKWDIIVFNPETEVIYIVQNINSFPHQYFHVSQITLQGKISPIYQSELSDFRGVENLAFDKDSLICIGRDLEEYEGVEHTLLLKLDKPGSVIRELVLNNLDPYTVPQSIKMFDNELYLVLDRADGQSFITRLDEKFENIVQHPISKPTGSVFFEKGIFKSNAHLILLGTFFSEKYPMDPYLSDRKIVAQSFDENLSESVWEYQYDHPGTSYTRFFRVNFDNEGNLFSLSSEAAGSDWRPANFYAPIKHYLRKFSPTGNKGFTIQTIIPISPFDKKNMYFDSRGNAFFRGQVGLWKWAILKVSADGRMQDTIQIEGRPESIFIDHDDNLYVYAAGFIDDSKKILTYDKDFSLSKEKIIQSSFMVQFQLPDDESLYGYFYDPIGPEESIFSLYKDDVLQWSKSTTLSWMPNALKQFEVNGTTGDLYFSDEPNSFTNKLHFLSFDGSEYNFLENPCGSSMYNLFSFTNGNILGISRTKDCLYDRTLNKLGNTDFLVGNTIPSFNFGTHLIQIKEGELYVFDSNGILKLKIRNPSFNPATGSNDVSSKFTVGQANNYGEFLPIWSDGFNFGFRWFRGEITYFDLKNHFDFSSLTSVDPITKVQNILKCFPNPTSDILTVKLPNQIKNFDGRIEICDVFGKRILIKKLKQNETTINIEVNHLVRGNYFLQLISKDDIWFEKIVLQ